MAKTTTIDKIQLGIDCYIGSTANGPKEHKFFLFNEWRPSSRIKKTTKKKYQKKMNQIFIDNKSFFLKDDDGEIIDSGGEIRIFIFLSLIIWVQTELYTFYEVRYKHEAKIRTF